MLRLRNLALVLPTALLLAGAGMSAARADTLLTANMTHSQETVRGTFLTSTGAPRPESFGFASFVLNDARTALTMTATIYNIDVNGSQTLNDTNDNLVAAHIHAPAPPGVNAPPVWGFFGLPDNDNNPDNLVVTPFASGVGGTFTSVWNQLEGNNTTLTAQLQNILSGQSYINFHTVQFSGGEIRGQITVVPEPSSVVLAGTGIVALIGGRLRRRARTAKPA
jgi:hypothetical protein